MDQTLCKLDSIYWAGSSIVLVRNIGGYWGAMGPFRRNAGFNSIPVRGREGIENTYVSVFKAGPGDNYLFIFF